MTDVDYSRRYGLVAIRGDEIVGQGIYLSGDGGQAEVAFAVGDRLQGKGLGTLLLAHLAEVAVDNGISVSRAEVMPENHRMIEVFRESGFPVEMESEPGVIRVVFPSSLAAEAVARFEDRDRVAAEAALRSFLEPRAVAVIGASRDRSTVGGQLFHNSLESGFAGVVYPVNPGADVVQSVHAYRSIGELPEPVELAVIAVPAAAVLDVARECADGGVKALVANPRLRGDRPGRRRTRARAGGDLPRRRNEADRAELPGNPQQDAGAERHLRAACPAAGRGRLRHPERRPRPRPDRPRR